VNDATRQAISRAVAAAALLLLGIWMESNFAPALAWAVVIALATWPTFRAVAARIPARPAAGTATA